MHTILHRFIDCKRTTYPQTHNIYSQYTCFYINGPAPVLSIVIVFKFSIVKLAFSWTRCPTILVFRIFLQNSPPSNLPKNYTHVQIHSKLIYFSGLNNYDFALKQLIRLSPRQYRHKRLRGSSGDTLRRTVF